jgi:hypothetical protein
MVGPPPPRWSNRAVAGVVLGLMACMAAAGLAFALLTVNERRAHDTGIARRPLRRAPQVEPEPLPPAPPATAPDKLEALGYLPDKTGLVLAVHVAELLADPGGHKLLTDGFRVGKVDVRPQTLARWTGLRPEDLDHLVVGARVDESIPPHLWVIARTKEPYDAKRLRDHLQAQRVAGTGDRVVYRFTAPETSLPLNLSCPDDRTIVVSLLADDLRVVPKSPSEDLSQLNPGLRTMIRERREVGSPLWVAVQVDSWPRVLGRPLFQGMKKEDLARLQGVRALGGWLQPRGEDCVRVKAVFRCKDAAAAAALDEFFHSPQRDANPSLKAAREGEWLTLQVDTDLAGLQKALAPTP